MPHDQSPEEVLQEIEALEHRLGLLYAALSKRAEAEPGGEQRLVEATAASSHAAEVLAALGNPFFRTLFESSLVGHALLTNDGIIVAVNHRLCELLEQGRQAIVGQSFVSIFRSDEKDDGRRLMAPVLAAEAPACRQRKRVRRGLGGHLWADVQVQGLRNRQGQVVGAVGTVADVDDLVTAREAMEQSEALFRSVVEQSREAIGLADQEGRYRLVNPAFCRLFGYSEQEVLALRVSDLVAPDHGEMELFQRVAAGQTGQLEAALVRKDGTRFRAVVSGSPVSVRGEQMILAVVRDVTRERRVQQERLSLEARIQQAQKLESLEVLAGGIAHDFNNLLVGVLGNADLALMDMPVESPARASVHAIVEAAQHAADLVRQMLAYAGKTSFRLERISLSALVEEMEHLLELSVSRKVVLRYEVDDAVPRVLADPTQVRQAVLNLVVNASEAIGDRSGVVAIVTGAMECDRAYLRETYLDDDLPAGLYAYVEVSDTGPGMDSELKERIFDPFFSTKFTGRGLGLAAVLGIVRSHRGAIKVYSEVGRGTTMKLLFPVPSEENGVQNFSTVPASLQGRRHGRVLLADDEETVLVVSRRMLQRLGFDVVTAKDGDEALARFQESPDQFDLVLLDLSMPGLSGEECFREMRRVKADVRVILSSGYSHKELEARFAGKGLAGFIQKPYSLSALADCIATVIAQSEDESHS